MDRSVQLENNIHNEKWLQNVDGKLLIIGNKIKFRIRIPISLRMRYVDTAGRQQTEILPSLFAHILSCNQILCISYGSSVLFLQFRHSLLPFLDNSRHQRVIQKFCKFMEIPKVEFRVSES